nr:PREDICTED: BTB/POZ domain-containing protein KCTD21 [Lepisosteus oculatus]
MFRCLLIMSDLVTLNVGGRLYTTSLATLTRFPDSVLGAMFKGRLPVRKDQQGHFFIDRDGKTFRHILNFLRSSHLDLPDDYKEMKLLRREAGFYQIQPLMEVLHEREAEDLASEKNAMLNISLDQKMQAVHLSGPDAPQAYSLGSLTIDVFSANIFCTSGAFLSSLGIQICYFFNGNLSPVCGEGEGQNRLALQWVGAVEGLPEEEYTLQNLKRLWVFNKQVNSLRAFVEEVLKITMNQGFCMDSSHPSSHDFTNTKTVRLIRYS